MPLRLEEQRQMAIEMDKFTVDCEYEKKLIIIKLGELFNFLIIERWILREITF